MVLLKKFNNLTPYSDVLIIGKRATGKTSLALNFVQNLKLGTVITDYKLGCETYNSKKPTASVHDTNKIKSYDDIFISTDEFTIFDIGNMRDIISDKYVKNMIMNHNHKQLSICALTHLLDIPPVLRSQFDYVFILSENNMGCRKKLYEQYINIKSFSFDDFCRTMDDVFSEDYQCLVINNTIKSDKLEDILFRYKCELVN
jgi:hypothetical protein